MTSDQKIANLLPIFFGKINYSHNSLRKAYLFSCRGEAVIMFIDALSYFLYNIEDQDYFIQ